MSKQEEQLSNYRDTLFHVIKWIEKDGDFDMLKPMSAAYVNRIARICHAVVSVDVKLEKAIKLSEEV
ncbi:hypothetical protein IIB50_01750 [Patescibacteria group bacterium]|nr:hypothetical protein [Patescibacteria group bacterium]